MTNHQGNKSNPGDVTLFLSRMVIIKRKSNVGEDDAGKRTPSCTLVGV